MQTKHFIDYPTALVHDALKALTLTNPNITLDPDNKIICASTQHEDQLSLISGGGSGHEPAFTGFVGPGFLTSSVAGTIFASPSSRQALTAIENVPSAKGVLVIFMNYTGDVMNFGVAIEKAKARNPGKRIEMLVVGDDVGVPRSKAGKVGRRGIAGTVLVQKIVGAMAAGGYGIDEVLRVGRVVCENLVSVGASLSRVHVPGRPVEQSSDAVVGAGQIELGMGIHNETGSGRVSGADAKIGILVAEMLRQLLDVNDESRNFLRERSDEVVLLINNLGSVSTLELGAITKEVIDQLQQNYSKKLVRAYCGAFMTSLDGPGFSISLLNAADLSLKESMLDLLDASSDVPGWKAVFWPKSDTTKVRSSPRNINGAVESDAHRTRSHINLICDLNVVVRRLTAGLQAVVASESEVTEYDNIVGDGDCGTTLKRGAQGILDLLLQSSPSDIVTLLEQSTSIVEDTMDGTSGALYAIFLNALTLSFKQRAQLSALVDASFWSSALTSAFDALTRYTPARVGDRTIVDALTPFIEGLKLSGQLQTAAQAALDGAESTRELRPRLGRTVYVGDEERWLGKVPDPGAWGLSKFLEGLAA